MFVKNELTGEEIEVLDITVPTLELTTEQKLQQYHDLTITLIREKYSIDDEFKFINIGINDINSSEYQTYRGYVEQCKQQSKLTLNIT